MSTTYINFTSESLHKFLASNICHRIKSVHGVFTLHKKERTLPLYTISFVITQRLSNGTVQTTREAVADNLVQS